MINDLKNYTDEQLLQELISRNPLARGPSKSTYSRSIREAIVGIGNDHIATILLHQDDADVLKERTTHDYN